VQTTCGYPSASISFGDAQLANDFDLYWAADVLNRTDELNLQDYNFTPVFSGSTTGDKVVQAQKYDLYQNGTYDKNSFDYCNGTNRNLWVTILRTKDSTPQVASDPHTERFLQQNSDVFIHFAATPNE